MILNFILNAIEGVIVGIISLPFVIVIHELGHLVCGKLSGYQFISLRLILFQWAKDKEGKIKFTRASSLFGVGGQCLMNPVGEEKDFRFKLYNLGGSLANLITGAIFLIPIFFVGHNWAQWLFIAGAVSIFMALVNLIPSASGGFPNDGRNVKEAEKSEDAKNGFYRMLKANGEMALGKHLSDFDEDFFKLSEEVDVDNFLVAHSILLHAAYLEEKEDYEKSYEKLLLVEEAKLPSIYKAQIILALFFNELVYQSTDEAMEKAKERWEVYKKDKEFRSIVEQKHPGFMIPYAAILAFLELKPKKARQWLTRAEKLIPSLQNPGTEHLAKTMTQHLNQRLPEEAVEESPQEKSDETVEPVSEESTEESMKESPEESTEKPTEEPVEELAEEPVEPIEEPVEEPSEVTIEESAVESPEQNPEEIQPPKSAVEILENMREEVAKAVLFEDTVETSDAEEIAEDTTMDTNEDITEEPTEDTEVDKGKNFDDLMEQFRKRR